MVFTLTPSLSAAVPVAGATALVLGSGVPADPSELPPLPQAEAIVSSAAAAKPFALRMHPLSPCTRTMKAGVTLKQMVSKIKFLPVFERDSRECG
jgi:hypothetical protein